MSRLEAIGERLLGVTREGLEHAEAMARFATQIDRMAAETRRLMQGTRGIDSQVLAQLEAASRACRVSAASLESVSRISRGWVAEHLGARGGAQVPGGGAGAPPRPGAALRPQDEWPQHYASVSERDEARMADAYGAALSTFLSGPRTPDSRTAFLRGWIREVNPGWTPEGDRVGNCGPCARAVQAALRGEPECAPRCDPPKGFETSSFMMWYTGRPQESLPPEAIARRLESMGPGASAIVGIDRDGPYGHWFNAYFDGAQVWYVDAQVGRVDPWPPTDLGAVRWDASFYEPSAWESEDGRSGGT